MTEHDAFDRDDELRAMLRDADPARALPPAEPAALSALLEDIMSTDLDVRPSPSEKQSPDEQVPDRGRGRTVVTWLVAAAAIVLIGGIGSAALSQLSPDALSPSATPSKTTGGDDTGGETATASGPTAPLPRTTTELTAGSESGRCAVPTAAFIAAQDQAFAGTVTAIEGDQVTLQATDVYTGQVGETVVVAAASPDLQALITATKFEVGGSYLVSATDGRVAVCGMSGKATGELRSLYEKAFLS